MLTANMKTFLRVRDTRILTGHVAQDNIFKLIHSRVRKHQRGVTLHHHWSGRHDLVFLRSEELLEGFTDFFCCQHNLFI